MESEVYRTCGLCYRPPAFNTVIDVTLIILHKWSQGKKAYSLTYNRTQRQMVPSNENRTKMVSFPQMIITLEEMMPNNEKMDVDERQKCISLVRPRYRKAGHKEKGKLLDEMMAVTGLKRKTLLHLINGSLERKPRARERGKTYKAPFEDALRVIYESFDYICAERLTPNLVWMAQMEQVSTSTVERRPSQIRQGQPRPPRKKPRPRNKRLQEIPMLRLPWSIAEPGQIGFQTSL